MVSNLDILDGVVQTKRVDPVIADFLRHTMNAESGCDANARSRSSSACGLFQFLDGTWNTMVRNHPGELSANGRFDPRQQSIAAVYYAQENAESLRAHGHAVTAGNLYLAHFLGAGGANAVLGGNPSDPIRNYVSPAALSANAAIKLEYTDAAGRAKVKSFANFTVGDLQAWSAKKMGGRINYALLDREVQDDTQRYTGEESDQDLGRFLAKGDLTFTTIIVGLLGLLNIFSGMFGQQQTSAAAPSAASAPAAPAAGQRFAVADTAAPATPLPTPPAPRAVAAPAVG